MSDWQTDSPPWLFWRMDAGPGIEPGRSGTAAYETAQLPLLHPRIDGERAGIRTLFAGLRARGISYYASPPEAVPKGIEPSTTRLTTGALAIRTRHHGA